jgi:hypothetical protein
LATDALDRAGIPWRIAFTSPSPAGLWSGVEAGLGVSVRTRFGLPGTLRVLNAIEAGLPPLPPINLVLHRLKAEPSRATTRLVAMLHDALLEGLAPVRRLTQPELERTHEKPLKVVTKARPDGSGFPNVKSKTLLLNHDVAAI